MRRGGLPPFHPTEHNPNSAGPAMQRLTAAFCLHSLDDIVVVQGRTRKQRQFVRGPQLEESGHRKPECSSGLFDRQQFIGILPQGHHRSTVGAASFPLKRPNNCGPMKAITAYGEDFVGGPPRVKHGAAHSHELLRGADGIELIAIGANGGRAYRGRERDLGLGLHKPYNIIRRSPTWAQVRGAALRNICEYVGVGAGWAISELGRFWLVFGTVGGTFSEGSRIPQRPI